MPFRNLIVNAAAGAGKTTRIVSESLQWPDRKFLITTFTRNNETEIRKKFIREIGFVPTNVKIQTWFSFLLGDFVRPYQRSLYDRHRIEGLAWVNGRSVPYIGEAQMDRHYLSAGRDIYSDKAAKFGVKCNEATDGAVISRLTALYDHIFIDEVQDLAAWDLDILELLFSADLHTTLVGDYRQSTYLTNNASKHRRYAGVNIINKFYEWAANDVAELENMAQSHRCNQEICDFADKFFPDAQDTESLNLGGTDHDGVFVIPSANIRDYVAEYSPQILRYSRRDDCDGLPALNFGDSKGLGFERVLIFPHGPFRTLLRNGNFAALNEPSKLYVAVTRAYSSVAIVHDGDVAIEGIQRL